DRLSVFHLSSSIQTIRSEHVAPDAGKRYLESRADPAPQILPAVSSSANATSRIFRELPLLRLTLTSSENAPALLTVPTRRSVRTTATCLSLLPAFSPPRTCDSSLSSATASKTFADSAGMEGGSGPVSTCKATLSAPSKRTDERLTGIFSPFVAASIACLA